MKYSVSQYDEAGKTAKKESKKRPHPNGKRPNALFRAVLFQLGKVLNDLNVADAVVKLGEAERMVAQQALQALLTAAANAPKSTCPFTAKRCFQVSVKDQSAMAEEEGKEVKWIFASGRHPDLINALRSLGGCKVLEQFGIYVEDDHGPLSAPTKRIQKLMFGDGDGAGRAKRGGA
jgi:hypothetical protein